MSFNPTADIMIKNALVLTMNAKKEVVQNGTILINGSTITKIGDATLVLQTTAKKVIDACGKIVMPGMINGHTHAPMVMYRGIGNDRKDILREVMFPLEKEFTTKEMCRHGALLSGIEMVRGGVICFADMYYFEDEIARAVQSIGLRAILGETVTKYPCPDAPQPYGGIKIAESFVQKWNDDPLITPAFAPHAPYSVGSEIFQRVHQLAEHYNVPVLTHLAEAPHEVKIVDESCELSSVQYLDRMGVLTERLIAAHCIYIDDRDISLLKERSVGVVLSMLGNTKGGVSQLVPGAKMFQGELRVGLGTDGPMSANTQDIISQLRFVSTLHKFTYGDRTKMPAQNVVEMATIGGARALHMEDKVGSLEEGKLADVIIVDNQASHQYPSYNPYQTLVYATFPTDVTTTIVHGKILMEDRELKTVDERAVRKNAEQLTERIVQKDYVNLSRLANTDDLPF